MYMTNLYFQVFLSSKNDAQGSVNNYEPVIISPKPKNVDYPILDYSIGSHYHDLGQWWTVRYVSGDSVYACITIISDGDHSSTLGPLIDQHGFQISEDTVRKFTNTFPITCDFILSRIYKFEPRSPMDTPEIH